MLAMCGKCRTMLVTAEPYVVLIQIEIKMVSLWSKKVLANHQNQQFGGEGEIKLG